MRHDDSSNRPRVNPAQNPHLAAVLGNVSLGLDENPDSRNPHSQPGRVSKPPPLPPPVPPPRRTPLPAAPAPLPEELYLPDNNEIELLSDDASAGLAQAEMPLQPEADDEIEPRSGEFQLDDPANSPSPLAETPPPPSLEKPRISLRPGVIAYGTELPADPAPQPEANPIELDAAEELIPSEFDGNSSELNASGLNADEASGGPEQSPWSKAAPPILIDKRDLPSSALSAPEAPQKAQAPETPAESEEKATATRSFVTLFLGIAVGACLVTFLLLYLGVLHGPEGAPSSNSAPIVVPPPVKTAEAPPTAAAVPTEQAAAPAESAAPSAEDIDSAAPSESAAPTAQASADTPAEDPSQKSASPQTAASTPTAPGVNTAPVVQKPAGGTAPPPKKKTRIF